MAVLSIFLPVTTPKSDAQVTIADKDSAANGFNTVCSVVFIFFCFVTTDLY